MAQRFGSLLSSTLELRPLVARAQSLSALQQHFANVAPAYLAQSCTVLGLKFGSLTIAVANAAAAAKLRQLAPELVVLLQNRGCEVSGIRVKVQVGYAPEPDRQLSRELSEPARQALTRLGESLGHSPLGTAVTKLSKSR